MLAGQGPKQPGAVVDHLQAAAERGELVVFVGAGVSVIAPTCLPSWWAINQAVLDALGSQAKQVADAEIVDAAIDRVKARQSSGKLPPEYQAEILASQLSGDKYFQVLQCLDGDTPNAVHLAIAALAKAGRVRAIVTTNFDRVLEAAFRAVGAPVESAFEPAHFDKLAGDLSPLDRKNGAPCQLLKIHGSAENPGTLIDTLAQRTRGLPAATRQCLRHLLGTSHWLFLGYSGADLEANPNYLSLRGDAATAKGFTWLVRQGSTAVPAVSETAKLYGERAQIVFGELPDWLAPLTTGLEVPAPATIDAATRKADAANAVVDHTQKWAANWGPLRSGSLLASVVDAASEGPSAIELLKSLFEKTPADERPLEPFAYVCASLAGKENDRGDYAAAMKLYEEASVIFENAKLPLKLAKMKSNRGDIHRTLGEYATALKLYEDAHAVFQTDGTDADRAHGYNDLAGVHFDRGEYEPALNLYESELEIWKKRGDELGRARTLGSIANVYQMMGRYEAALKNFDEYIAIATRLGDDSALAAAVHNKANAFYLRGENDDYAQAEKLWNQSAAINERLGEVAGKAHSLANLSNLYVKRKRLDDAVRVLTDVAAMMEKSGDREGLARALGNLGNIDKARKNWDAAIAKYTRVFELFDQMENAGAKAPWLTELAGLERERKNYDRAAQIYREALAIFERNADHDWAGNCCYNLGGIDWERDKNAEALTWAKNALAHYEAGHRPDKIRDAKEMVAIIERKVTGKGGCLGVMLAAVSVTIAILFGL